MNRFLAYLVKFTVVVCAHTALGLLSLALLLVFSPESLLTAVYCVLITACILGAVYVIACLLWLPFRLIGRSFAESGYKNGK